VRISAVSSTLPKFTLHTLLNELALLNELVLLKELLKELLFAPRGDWDISLPFFLLRTL